MQDMEEYRVFHGLPVRTFEQGPLRHRMPHLHESDYGGQKKTQGGHVSTPEHQPGISFLLDDTGHWVDPEVGR